MGAVGGVVETSTVNCPVRSRFCFMTGVMAFQLWLFWPSRIKIRMGAAWMLNCRTRSRLKRKDVSGEFTAS